MDELLIAGRDFVGDVYRLGSWRGELPPATSLSRTGAAAMAELVTSHPAVGGGELPEERLTNSADHLRRPALHPRRTPRSRGREDDSPQ